MWVLAITRRDTRQHARPARARTAHAALHMPALPAPSSLRCGLLASAKDRVAVLGQWYWPFMLVCSLLEQLAGP